MQLGVAILPGRKALYPMAPVHPLQVGVISWGVVDVCKGQRGHQEIPGHARDFHINLFQVLPWLKDKLQEEDLGFL